MCNVQKWSGANLVVLEYGPAQNPVPLEPFDAEELSGFVSSH